MADLWKPTLLDINDKISHTRIKVSSVAAGLEHCLIVSQRGDIYAFGRNHKGQLGLGTTADTNVPTFVAALTRASTVAAGEDHSAATTQMGEVYTWGSADCGKLGHGASMVHSTMGFPKKMKLIDSRITQVSCGPSHTALVGAQGQLYTFGAGWFGRLGHGDMQNQPAPKQIAYVHRQVEGEASQCPRFTEVRCASFHTCAVCDKYSLWIFGKDSLCSETDHVTVPLLFSKISDNLEVLSVAVGANHTLVLSAEGHLWAWGDNSKGQLGLGPQSPSKVFEPVQVKCRNWLDKKSERGTNAMKGCMMSVSCGYQHSLALVDTGDVYGFGLRSGGRLGLAEKMEGKNCCMPEKVDPSWKKVEKETEPEAGEVLEDGERMEI